LYNLSALTDLHQIRIGHSGDLACSASLIIDPEPPYLAHSNWHAATRSWQIKGFSLTHEGLEPPIVFLMGEKQALGSLVLDNVLVAAAGTHIYTSGQHRRRC
jgi:hypothetical protein